MRHLGNRRLLIDVDISHQHQSTMTGAIYSTPDDRSGMFRNFPQVPTLSNIVWHHSIWQPTSHAVVCTCGWTGGSDNRDEVLSGWASVSSSPDLGYFSVPIVALLSIIFCSSGVKALTISMVIYSTLIKLTTLWWQSYWIFPTLARIICLLVQPSSFCQK